MTETPDGHNFRHFAAGFSGVRFFRPATKADQMELTCDKYKIKMESEKALCEHLEEYCKFRGACIINFITRERQRRERDEGHAESGHDGADQGRQT